MTVMALAISKLTGMGSILRDASGFFACSPCPGRY